MLSVPPPWSSNGVQKRSPPPPQLLMFSCRLDRSFEVGQKDTCAKKISGRVLDVF